MRANRDAKYCTSIQQQPPPPPVPPPPQQPQPAGPSQLARPNPNADARSCAGKLIDRLGEQSDATDCFMNGINVDNKASKFCPCITFINIWGRVTYPRTFQDSGIGTQNLVLGDARDKQQRNSFEYLQFCSQARDWVKDIPECKRFLDGGGNYSSAFNIPREIDYAATVNPEPRPAPTAFQAYVNAFRATFLHAQQVPQHTKEYEDAYNKQRKINQAGQVMSIVGGAVGTVTSGITAATSIEVLTRLDALIGQVDACRETFESPSGASAESTATWGW